MKESFITGIVYPVAVVLIGFLAKVIIWDNRRNIIIILIKYPIICIAIALFLVILLCYWERKLIATIYKNIKAKIDKYWEKRVGIEDKNKEIEALKQQHKEELAKKDEEIEELKKTNRKHLADANTIIGLLYEPPQNAWDFLCDIRNIEGVKGIFRQNCYIIIHEEWYNNKGAYYILAKILHIGNGNDYGNNKGMLDAITEVKKRNGYGINQFLTIEQILEEHTNNRETLTYEPPHLPTNHG